MLKHVSIGQHGGRPEKAYIGDVKVGNVNLSGMSDKNARLDGVRCIGSQQSRLDDAIDQQITKSELINRENILLDREIEETGKIGKGIVDRMTGIAEAEVDTEEAIEELLNSEFGVRSGAMRGMPAVSVKADSTKGIGMFGAE